MFYDIWIKMHFPRCSILLCEECQTNELIVKWIIGAAHNTKLCSMNIHENDSVCLFCHFPLINKNVYRISCTLHTAFVCLCFFLRIISIIRHKNCLDRLYEQSMGPYWMVRNQVNHPFKKTAGKNRNVCDFTLNFFFSFEAKDSITVSVKWFENDVAEFRFTYGCHRMGSMNRAICTKLYINVKLFIRKSPNSNFWWDTCKTLQQNM